MHEPRRQPVASPPVGPPLSRARRLARTSVWLGSFGVGLATGVAIGALGLVLVFADWTDMSAVVYTLAGLVGVPLVTLGIVVGTPLALLLCVSALVVGGFARSADGRERAAGSPTALGAGFRVMVWLEIAAIVVSLAVAAWGAVVFLRVAA